MNNVIRSMPQVGTRDGDWIWDGSRWVCDPNCNPSCDPDFRPPFVTPAFFPPPVFSGPTAQPPWYPGANGGVSFGSVAPPNPTRGHFWWNGTILQMFDGAAWVTIGGGSTTPGGGPSTGAGTVIISATAPGNPQVGAQWWDGTTLRVWDGTQWNIVGPGAAAGPVPTTTETFRMVSLTDISISSGDIYSIVPFTSSPTVDTQLAWDQTTKKLTPKKAGVYLFSIRGLGGAPAFGIVLTKNDTGTLDLASTPIIGEAFSDGGAALSTEAISVMNGTTDFVRMWATSGSGALNAMGGGLPMIQAYLLP